MLRTSIPTFILKITKITTEMPESCMCRGSFIGSGPSSIPWIMPIVAAIYRCWTIFEKRSNLWVYMKASGIWTLSAFSTSKSSWCTCGYLLTLVQ
jgi:hypothetical protein